MRPIGNNADEWHEFLSEYLDNRATSPNGLAFMAVQIAEAMDAAEKRGCVFAMAVGTTLPSVEEEREQFERWFEAEAKPLEARWFRRDGNGNGDYIYDLTDWAWRGWLARARLTQQDANTVRND